MAHEILLLLVHECGLVEGGVEVRLLFRVNFLYSELILLQ